MLTYRWAARAAVLTLVFATSTQAALIAVNHQINPSSRPDMLYGVGDQLFFRANNHLWRSTGSPATTTDISSSVGPIPVNSGIYFNGMVQLNNELVFAGSQFGNIELWKSDGTASGTAVLKDINPAGSSSPAYLTNVNGTLYFWADDGVNGRELWKSDGSAGGTSLVADINPSGGAFSAIHDAAMGIVGSNIFFSANDGTTGSELWTSDGTAAGTTLVKDIAAGTNSYPHEFVTLGNSVFFNANRSADGGWELWKSDGTEAGTSIVKDMSGSSLSSDPQQLTNINGTLYFSAADNTHGRELWKSDGTEAGTLLVKDILPGGSLHTGGSVPAYLVEFDDTLYFSASDGAGRDIWTSDGTETGTVAITSLAAQTVYNLTVADDKLFFVGAFQNSETSRWHEILYCLNDSGDLEEVFRIEDLNTNATIQDLTWTGRHLFFTAPDSLFFNGTPNTFDLYSVAIPEPASGTVLLMGLASLMRRRRRN